MDITKLIRDPSKVLNTLVELPDGSVVTKQGCKIYIPARFTEVGLADLDAEIYTVGIYPIVVDTYYSVCSVNAKMRIMPSSIIRMKIDQVEYIEFSFDPGSTVIASKSLVRQDSVTYYIYDELISKGKIPWYLNYTDMGSIFNTSMKHADSRVGNDKDVIELIISMIARDASNLNTSYRTIVESLNDIKTNPPSYIPLRNVSYGASNTLNKLAGSYFHEGVTSALVNPSTKVEYIEKLLRA